MSLIYGGRPLFLYVAVAAVFSGYADSTREFLFFAATLGLSRDGLLFVSLSGLWMGVRSGFDTRPPVVYGLSPFVMFHVVRGVGVVR